MSQYKIARHPQLVELLVQGSLLFKMSQTLLPDRFGLGAPGPGDRKVALQGGLQAWHLKASLGLVGCLGIIKSGSLVKCLFHGVPSSLLLPVPAE